MFNKEKQLEILMNYFSWHSKDNKNKWKDFLKKFIDKNIFLTCEKLGIPKKKILKFLIIFYCIE